MKTLAILAVILTPSMVCAQYIGNPCGKAVPRGIPNEPFPVACGFMGIDIGLSRFDVEANYWGEVDGGRTTLRETSELRETWFAVSGGCNIEGLEVEGRLGGTWIKLREDYVDPFEDSSGVLVGLGGRYGFSPGDFLRLGIGGQFQYSYSEGETSVGVFTEDSTLDLFRGQLFTGASLDLKAGRDLVFCPYVGAGIEFMDGEITVEDFSDYVGADLRERHAGFIFGGLDMLDMNIGRRGRVGLEARTNFDGWLVQVSFGVRF